MRTIRTKVYQFSELSDKAKSKAVDNCRYLNVDYDWWDQVYEDAAQIGLKITGFDIGRGQDCTGEFMGSAEETAHKIEKEHGEMCETYKTAAEYLKERDELINTAERDENGDFVDEYELDGKLDDLDAEFLKSLCEDYRIMLSNEYDYLTTDKAIIETIEANEYEFKADGTRF